MEFKLEILQGAIPIEFYCDEAIGKSFVAASPGPRTYHVLASRYSYLPVVVNEWVEDLKARFLVEIKEPEVWFESDGFALKGNQPIGVLFDCCQPQATAQTLPWKIKVRFQAFPVHLFVKCLSIDAASRFYYQSIKQALFCIYSDGSAFNHLSGEKKDKLWSNFDVSGGFDVFAFEAIVQDLCPKNTSVKNIPVRILKQSDHSVRLKSVKRDITANGITRSTTVRDVIEQAMGADLAADMWWVMAHGVEVPWDSPITETWELLCHADMFLYLILHEP